MQSGSITLIYLVAAIMFIFSLGGLSSQVTARRGNAMGILGMLIAVVVAITSAHIYEPIYLIGVVLIGSVVGWLLARRVAMTAMPQLVAILHSFVGLAAVFVGIGGYLDPLQSQHPINDISSLSATIHHLEIFIGVFIGAITFTGSIVAFAKLQGLLTGKPMLLPGRHLLNAMMVVACLVLCWRFMHADGNLGFAQLIAMTAIASVLGAHLILAIGGADMPVVVSMLNSYSGWAASATGFMLANDLLIITGALVGSSGAILSYIMCRAMNRSFFSVILGGFGAEAGSATGATAGSQADVTSVSAEDTALLLREAREIIFVPGYGMAVAQAQYAVREITEILRKSGVKVRFAIHPVAGRLPGHMNVLLAEASVPYDIVLEMEEINGDFPRTDVVVVVGANDIVNPDALTNKSSPIYGMPVLKAWEAKTVIVLKRSMASGYAGIDNPLFYNKNSKMLFGDAQKSMASVLACLR